MAIKSSIITFLLLAMCVLPLVKAATELVTHEATFQIAIGDKPAGTIRMGLFGTKAPRTVENFVAFADQGVRGKRYEKSIFHRVIKDFMIQGGDVLNGDGTGSISKFGSQFKDEFPSHRHSVPGLLSMANSGPDTNGSQFFITTVLTHWLDGKHVVFGKVLDPQSMQTVKNIEKVEVDESSRPYEVVSITKSSVRQLSPNEQIRVDIGAQ